MYIKKGVVNNGEKIFKDLMNDKGFTLVPHPYIRELKMTPDFYCVEDKTYYEIITTRQAYHSRKQKMWQAQRFNLNLKIVNPDGSPYIPRRRGPRDDTKRGEKNLIRKKMIQEYLNKGLSQLEISRMLGISKQLVRYWVNLILGKAK